MKKQDIIEIFFGKLFPVAVFSFIMILLVIQEDISLAKQVISFPGIDADLACNKQVQEALSLLESEPLHDPRAPRWVGKLAASLKPGRFAHSLSVAWMSRRLAHVHGLDPLKAEQAGLLHDCAKCLPLDEMQRIAVDHSLTDDPELLASGALLHSVVGSWVAREVCASACQTRSSRFVKPTPDSNRYAPSRKLPWNAHCCSPWRERQTLLLPAESICIPEHRIPLPG